MFCPFCSSPIPESAKFCPNCRGSLAPERQWLEDAQRPDYSDSSYAQHQEANLIAGESNQKETNSSPAVSLGPVAPGMTRETLIEYAEADGHGMKWYKFLTAFALIATAVLRILSGIAIFLTLFVQPPILVQVIGPVLRAVGPLIMLFALLDIVLGALNILACRRMAKFQKDAPKVLYVVLGLGIVIDALNLTLASGPLALISLIPSIVAIVLNVLYFNKRSYLFVNE